MAVVVGGEKHIFLRWIKNGSYFMGAFLCELGDGRHCVNRLVYVIRGDAFDVLLSCEILTKYEFLRNTTIEDILAMKKTGSDGWGMPRGRT